MGRASSVTDNSEMSSHISPLLHVHWCRVCGFGIYWDTNEYNSFRGTIPRVLRVG
jgi:hypothetical protein